MINNLPSNNYYINLIIAFPPRPINNEDELAATQNRINFILDTKNLTQDDRDYLKVLGMLVYDYEERYEPIPKLQDAELLQAVLEETNLQTKDLVGIFKNEETVLNVLQNQRHLTADERQKLIDFSNKKIAFPNDEL